MASQQTARWLLTSQFRRFLQRSCNKKYQLVFIQDSLLNCIYAIYLLIAFIIDCNLSYILDSHTPSATCPALYLSQQMSGSAFGINSFFTIDCPASGRCHPRMPNTCPEPIHQIGSGRRLTSIIRCAFNHGRQPLLFGSLQIIPTGPRAVERERGGREPPQCKRQKIPAKEINEPELHIVDSLSLRSNLIIETFRPLPTQMHFHQGQYPSST